MKKEGLCRVSHHPAIIEEDLQTLYNCGVFSLGEPKSLQRKVFFDIMFYFCRRGRENLRHLTKYDFEIKINANNVEYAVKVNDELSKNHRENDENQETGVMMATSTETCPIKSLKLYLNKLNPKLNAFFQRPSKNIRKDDQTWYDNMVVGERYLADMMKNISKDAKLSQVYTNHCIRATTITILDKAGIEARHIMSVSGHRSETSIRSYSKTGNELKRKMSETLSGSTVQSTTGNVSQSSRPHVSQVSRPVSPAALHARNFNFGDGLHNAMSDTPTLPPVVQSCSGNVIFNSCTFNIHK